MKTAIPLLFLLISPMAVAGSQVIVETKLMSGGPETVQEIKIIMEGARLRLHEAKAEQRSDDYLLYDSLDHLLFKVMPWSKSYLELKPEHFMETIVAVRDRKAAEFKRLEKQLSDMGLGRILTTSKPELINETVRERVVTTFDLGVEEIRDMRRYSSPLSLKRTGKRARMNNYACGLFERYQNGVKQLSIWVTDWDATILTPQEIAGLKVVLQFLAHNRVEGEACLLWQPDKLPFWGLAPLQGLPLLVVEYRNGRPYRQSSFSYQQLRTTNLRMLEIPEGYAGSKWR